VSPIWIVRQGVRWGAVAFTDDPSGNGASSTAIRSLPEPDFDASDIFA